MILLDGGRALVRCKHCKNVVHAVHRKHHLKECRIYAHKQKLGRMAFEKDGKKLYAVALQRFDPKAKTWSPEMHYTHAYDSNHAKRSVLAGEKRKHLVSIVDAGLAVGMFTADRDGTRLVAD